MKADLHVHSTASDGTFDARELVTMALQRDLSVLAIADHDSVAGLPKALEAAEGTSLTMVPAVELSSVEGNRDVHVLGYFIDHEDERLHAHLADLREARLRRAQAMVQALKSAGYVLDLDDVLSASAGGAVGRSHIARALVSLGHATSIHDAFERLIGRGRPFYVRKDVRSASDVIATIKAAEGVAVVAHPGVSGLDDLIPQLVDAGLGGIEAYHADHDPEQRERYARVARHYGLLITGGSDYHGEGAPNPEMGSVEIPEDVVNELLAWGEARR